VLTAPEAPQAPSGEETFAFGGGGAGQPPRLTTDVGFNRFVWDMRYAEATRFPGMILWGGEMRGPRLVPGTYQVRLTVDGKTLTESFEVRRDPRLSTTPEEFAKQFALLMKIRDKLTETHNGILQIREVRRQVEDLSKRLDGQPQGKPVIEAGRALNAKLTAIEEELYQTKNQSSQDPLNFPIRLNNKLAELADVVSSADSPPTEQSYALYEELVTRIDAQLQRLNQTMTSDLKAFNQLVRSTEIPAVIARPAPTPEGGQ
jgi:hypothetical protein